MADRGDPESANPLVVAHVLEKLRGRGGLVLARLQEGRSGSAAPLLDLPAIRDRAADRNIELAAAALDIVAQCVRDTDDGTHRIVADVVLALGLFSDVYSSHGLDEKTVSALRADSLGKRRSTLLTHWRRLHEALDVAPGVPPSDRTLRGTTEPAVLKELARQLIWRGSSPINVKKAAASTATEVAPRDSSMRPRPRVIVVGGAVMDVTFSIKALPQHETSTEAHGFDLSPGGKGFTQAIAAARLGLDVSLIAALSDDRYGEEIVQRLREAGVDTSLLKIVPGAQTGFTGVIERELGDSTAVNWRGEARLDVEDIDQWSEQLAQSDAVLTTFEIPRETVQRTLALANATQEVKPLVIVTPAHPYSGDTISHRSLLDIDYLVGRLWELERLFPQGQEKLDRAHVTRYLLEHGVKTLCILGDGGCTIYSETDSEAFSVPVHASIYKESAMARDAFCAALAAKLVDDHQEFSQQTAIWASTAMACAAEDFSLATPMPDRGRIERKLRVLNLR